jgi:hypothetical protein
MQAKSYRCLRPLPTPHSATLWMFGGRYRIRTYDFHRVKVALYR